jgi:hypothetical protein
VGIARQILDEFNYPFIQKKQLVLNVGAASSREINCRGWKPIPQKVGSASAPTLDKAGLH